jgi:NAD(P)-dependent dehydrogenase (short-subunit alcohol dehydrogenase family)
MWPRSRGGRLFDEALEDLGGLDVLVNNAGIKADGSI